MLNLTTSGLILFGGLGFLVILDILKKRSFRKLCLHSKVVITTSVLLLLIGTLLLKATENVTWLGAFFQSVSARTAGFSTYPIGEFTNAGLFTLIILMFVGASPGSTGGGIKTSTFFVLIQQIRSLYTKRHIGAFHRSITLKRFPKRPSSRCFPCCWSAPAPFCCVYWSRNTALYNCCLKKSRHSARSGFPRESPDLNASSKMALIVTMFAGRVGVFTLLSMWIDRPAPTAYYTGEEAITIG